MVLLLSLEELQKVARLSQNSHQGWKRVITPQCFYYCDLLKIVRENTLSSIISSQDLRFPSHKPEIDNEHQDRTQCLLAAHAFQGPGEKEQLSLTISTPQLLILIEVKLSADNIVPTIIIN